MNLTEYCWTTAEYITKRKPTEIKLRLDNTIEYPTFEKDAKGFVLSLSAPRRLSEDLLLLHGMPFDNDIEGRLSLWRMFRASLYHLCIHSVVAGFDGYQKSLSLRENRGSRANSYFAMSVVEDYVIRAYARALWPGLLQDLAYANYTNALRFRDFDRAQAEDYVLESPVGEENGLLGIDNDPLDMILPNRRRRATTVSLTLADRIAANILSYTAIKDKAVARIDKEIDSDIRKTVSNLEQFGQVASEIYSKAKLNSGMAMGDSTFGTMEQLRVMLFKEVLSIFEKNSAYLSSVHFMPHRGNYGGWQDDELLLFDSTPTKFRLKDQDELYSRAMIELGIEATRKIEINDENNSDLLESESVLGTWEYSVASQNSLVEQYKKSDPMSHFESVCFPSEDYAEFVRTRSRLAGPISSLLDELRVVNFSLDEAPFKEIGEIDLENAIQSVSGGRASNDIFKREEFIRRDEAWSILIDSSKSLEAKKQDVRDIAICLSEIADNLIQKSFSWACYSFNENFYILKDFLESYDRVSKGRIGGLPNGIKTLLPDALKLAARRLMAESEEVKVMLVVSDGFPLGYQGIDNALIKTIEQIKNSGILLVGLGIGSSAIKKYFSSNLVVEGTYDLMKQFVQTYLQLPYIIL